jgi:hypothetical protein
LKILSLFKLESGTKEIPKAIILRLININADYQELQIERHSRAVGTPV